MTVLGARSCLSFLLRFTAVVNGFERRGEVGGRRGFFPSFSLIVLGFLGFW